MTSTARALRPETTLITAGRGGDPAQPINLPIVPMSNFRSGHTAEALAAADRDGTPAIENEPAYARGDGAPGWKAIEQLVGGLEGGYGVAFSSGMAAIAAIIEQLPAGATIVVPSDCYMGLTHLLADGAAVGKWNVRTVYAADPDEVEAALPGADLLWLESPSNPLLEIADIERLAASAHAVGAVVAVDNTFATPLLQNPLALGADYVIHSATKYIGGHSDLLMGIAVAKDPADYARLMRRSEVAGATPGALEAFLALRGARTLSLRLAQAQATAMELARRLAEHPAVTCVRYPGLPDHPQHELAKKQMRGFGAMVTFDVADADTADTLVAALQVIEHATSLGGVESLIERRAKIPGQEHLPAGLLRFSVGCEHVEDLWDDLSSAIATATTSRS